jgi:hypothetical protein
MTRAPSQLRKESADGYIVGNPHGLKIGGRDYPAGKIVDGQVAQSWATFRSLLGIAWLIPVKNEMAQAPMPVAIDTAPASRRARRR